MIYNNIVIVDGMFQLRLMSADICQKWYSEVSLTLLVFGLNSVLIYLLCIIIGL